jgi:hypothetical protein
MAIEDLVMAAPIGNDRGAGSFFYCRDPLMCLLDSRCPAGTRQRGQHMFGVNGGFEMACSAAVYIFEAMAAAAVGATQQFSRGANPHGLISS